ncbi:cytochrome P450 [Fusarium redolens]|uniref:Cytochrome P450 n=1 Tax=Fusarium redolens TaxID=48865 RepID=A0A9P9FU55_FUSRE|nr:cytochrome P450 [Fusarium redolens]KAH7205127.1 cytochrome P450 [Fusarium redolens]
MELSDELQLFFRFLLPEEAPVTWAHLSLLSLGSVLIYYLLRIPYLLYFHPLSSFRGPFWAAISTWWLYSVCRTGHAEQVFEQLHRKYSNLPDTRGLRIGPNEIHISDSTLYHNLYSQDHSFAKEQSFYDTFGTPHSVFVETDRGLHRQRRKLLNNFFSKTSIRNMQNILYEKVSTLSDIMSNLGDEESVNIYNAVRCMTVDIISELAFGHSFNLLGDAKDGAFVASYLGAFDMASDYIWEMMFFPSLRRVLNMIPPSLMTASPFTRLFQSIEDTVTIFREMKASGNSCGHDIMFDLLSGLGDRELVAEAGDILVAGSDTTATTLAVAIYQLISHPEAYDALKTEIRPAMLKTAEDYDLKSIEQLPYLTACVKESLRIASAVPSRLPRVVPPSQSKASSLIVDGKVIPPGSVVSISSYTVHGDQEIWGADAQEFNPSRWLGPRGKQLEKYLVTFSKGARSCLGINLAHAELTIALAMFTSRFDMVNDGTTKDEDHEVIDSFTAGFRGTGPRVKVSPV